MTADQIKRRQTRDFRLIGLLLVAAAASGVALDVYFDRQRARAETERREQIETLIQTAIPLPGAPLQSPEWYDETFQVLHEELMETEPTPPDHPTDP